MNEKENKQQGLQIELTPEVAQGEYANFAIMRYEREYGQIKIPNQEPRTIAPFGTSKGEA